MIRKLKSLTSGEVINPDIVRENIPDGAVNTAKIEDRAVTEDKIENGAVTFNKIADGAISESKVEDGAISESKIQNGVISRNKIQNDAITTDKIEDGSITYQKLDSDLQKDTYFIEGERIKTLNLLNCLIDSTPAEENYTLGTTSLKAGTYTFKLSATSGTATAYLFRINGTEYGTTSIGDSVTFTLNSDVNNGIVTCYINGTTTDLIAMLNEGSQALPYQPYNGAIIHKVDIEPVLLWENANPNTSFAEATITTADMSKYKYIVIEYKAYYANNQSTKFLKSAIKDFDNGRLSLTDVFESISEDLSSCRNMIINSTTSITIGDNYTNQNVDNTRLIPVAIYGTNLL